MGSALRSITMTLLGRSGATLTGTSLAFLDDVFDMLDVIKGSDALIFGVPAFIIYFFIMSDD